MKRLPEIPRSARERIRLLDKIKNRFSSEERALKLALLTELVDTEIRNTRQLIAYHEALLFIRAYPDDKKVLELVRRECAEFGDRVDVLRRCDRNCDERLVDSGIARTSLSYYYDYSTLSRLVKWYGDALEIDWDAFEHTERIYELLPLLAGWRL